MTMNQKIDALKEAITEANPNALFCDGHDEDLIGMCTRFGMEPVAAYDYDKFIARLMRQGMSREAAVEWFEFNTLGAWAGEGTPVFIEHVQTAERKFCSN